MPFVGFTEMPDRQVVDLLGAMRELVGDDITLGIDPGYRWIHWQEALWVLNRLDEHRIFFAEAPLRHDDIEGYRQLAARSPLLIGAAEFATGRYEAREWLETAKVPLLHCGVSRAGGSPKSHAFQRCELAGAMLMPHSYASAISTSPTFTCRWRVCRCRSSNSALEPVTSILRRELVSPAMPKIADGWIAAPTTPGLGVELNTELVERFRLS